MMTSKQLQRECQFGTSMVIANNLLKQEIITQKEYIKIKKMLLKKYAPLIAGSAEHPKLFT